MPSASQVFARITKVDEQKRLVYGRAGEEVTDRADEIFDYATSKPNFLKWSAETYSDSKGKSFGNVRAMHGAIAAGRLDAITFDDAAKAIDVVAHIVDDNEWKKVMAGVYTGFSIGGKYVNKWADVSNGKRVTRYTADPAEVSIVDRPCCPTAVFFDIMKADGSTVHKAFAQPAGTTIVDNANNDAHVDEDGNPIGDASKGFEQPTDATSGIAPYNLEGKKKVKPVKKVALVKGAAGVAHVAALIRDLGAFSEARDLTKADEAFYDRVDEAVSFLQVSLTDRVLAGDEVTKFAESDDMTKALGLMLGFDMEKRGARNNAGDLKLIQGVHDAACTLGAGCAAATPAAKADGTNHEENDMTDLKKGGVGTEAPKRGAKVTPKNGQKIGQQSANGENDPEEGVLDGASVHADVDNDSDKADDGDVADIPKKFKMKKSDAGEFTAEDLQKAIVSGVVGTLQALGIIPDAEALGKADGGEVNLRGVNANQTPTAKQPVFKTVGKDGTAEDLTDPKQLIKTVTPINEGRDVNTAASLMKAVHSHGPSQRINNY